MVSGSRRVLVTGAGGFVGRVAVAALVAEGREVVATGGHPAVRQFQYVPLLGGVPDRRGRLEVGFNETVWYKERSKMASVFFEAGARIGMDTHGGTSHLTGRDVDDIVNFMKTIE